MQSLIGTCTSKPAHAGIVRTLLAVLGTGMGVITAMHPTAGRPVVAFAIGFGLLHVPPAAVLFLKHQRSPDRSPPR